jgi:hypothetical protein
MDRCHKNFGVLMWWVKPQNASHLGLYIKVYYTSDIEEAKKFQNILKVNLTNILICLSKQSISKHEPVGESTDKGWWNKEV